MIIVEVIHLPGYSKGERIGFHSESRVRELTTCRPPAVRVIETRPDDGAVVLPQQPISQFLQNKFGLNPDGSPRVAKQDAPPPPAPVVEAPPPKDALELLAVPKQPARKVK